MTYFYRQTNGSDTDDDDDDRLNSSNQTRKPSIGRKRDFKAISEEDSGDNEDEDRDQFIHLITLEVDVACIIGS